MPLTVAIGAVTGAILGAAGAIGGLGALAGAVLFGGLAAAQYLITLAFQEKPRVGALGGSARSTLRQESAAARWWFGRCRANGMIAHAIEADDADAIWLVYAVSEAPIEALHGLWIGAEYVPLAADGARMARPAISSDSIYRDHLWAWPVLDGSASPSRLAFRHDRAATGLHAGTQTADWQPEETGLRYDTLLALQAAAAQAAADAETGVDIPGWGNDKRLDGIAHVILRLEQPEYGRDLDDRVWSGLPEVAFDITGLRFATAPGTAVQARDNAADVRYWWLRERRGRSDDEIDQAAYLAARAVCAEQVQTTLPAGYDDYESTSPRYRVSGLITAEDDAEGVEAELDFAWAGEAVEFDGQVFMRPGAPRPVTAAIGADDIISVGSVAPQPPLQERLNRAGMGLAQSAAHEFRQVRLVPIQDDVGVDRDGEVIERDLGERAFVSDPVAGLRLLKIALRKARAALTAELVIMPGAAWQHLTIQPSDIVTLTLDEYGFAAKKFRVLAARVAPDWNVALSLEEWADDVYDAVSDLPPLRPAVALAPPAATPPPPPAVVAATAHAAVQQDGTIRSQALVRWTPRAYAADLFLADAGYSVEAQVIANRGVVEVDLPGPGAYSGSLRLINRDGVRSAATPFALTLDWAALTPPAPVVASVSVLSGAVLATFAAVDDRDVAGLEVRYTSGAIDSTDPLPVITAADWDDADRIDVAAIVAPVRGQQIYASFLIPASGRFRFFARYVTRSGLEGPIGEVGNFLLALPVRDGDTIAVAPAWEGTVGTVAAIYAAAGNMLVGDSVDAGNGGDGYPYVTGVPRRAWNGEEGWPFGPSDAAAFTSSWYPLGGLKQASVFYNAEIFEAPNPAAGQVSGVWSFQAQPGVEQDDGTVQASPHMIILDAMAWVTIPTAATHLRVVIYGDYLIKGSGIQRLFFHWRELA